MTARLAQLAAGARRSRAGSRPGGRRRVVGPRPRSPAITPASGARGSGRLDDDVERQLEVALADREPVGERLAEDPPARSASVSPPKPGERLRRAEPLRRAADEQHAGRPRARRASPNTSAARAGRLGQPIAPRTASLWFQKHKPHLDPPRLRVDVQRAAADEAAERDAAVGGEARPRATTGAPTATSSGQPATAAFWTSSNESRPLTQRIEPESGAARRGTRADDLVERVVAADVLAHAEQLAVGREEPGRVQAAGHLERRLRRAQPVRERRDEPAATRRSLSDRGRLDRDRLERALAADAARGRRVEAPLEPRRRRRRARRPRPCSRRGRRKPRRERPQSPRRGRSRARAPRRARASASSPRPGRRRSGSRAAPRRRRGRPPRRRAPASPARGPCSVRRRLHEVKPYRAGFPDTWHLKC